jgi:hypothetical protein
MDEAAFRIRISLDQFHAASKFVGAGNFVPLSAA